MLKLIYAPDPILKKESVSIPQVDDHHRELIKQMYEVMYSANGVGLAAPQIGLNIRIFILDACSRDEEKKPITIINPKIIILMGSTAMEAVTGINDKVSLEKGSWKEIILNNKTYPLIITFSPSYLIRFPDNKRSSWEDLKRIKRKIEELNIKF